MKLEKPADAAAIAKTLRIKGEVDCDEDLVVMGKIEGTIRQTKDLYIDGTGEVRANISGPGIQVGGKLFGNVTASKKIELLAGGQMVGDILAAPRVEIVEGARFKGKIDMGDVFGTGATAPTPSPAPAAPPTRPGAPPKP